MSNRIVAILLGGTIITGIAMAILIMNAQQSLSDSPFNKQMFDEKLWKNYAHSIDRDNPRGMMVNDVKKRLFEQPISKQGIVKMLGEPDREDEESLSYDLGMWSNNRTQRDAMNIYLDTTGRIREIRFEKP